MLRKRLALALAATTLGSLSLFSPADASHSWGNYHWARTSNPFLLKVGDNVNATWQSYYDVAVADWTAATVLNLSSVDGSGGKRCAASRGTVQVCNGKYGQNGWLGLASISITGGTHITAGTAKMNDTYFSMAYYNTPEEKRHVMCQEVGHTLGLGHTSEDGSTQHTCMDYSQSSTSTHPNAHDYAQLESIYAHLDSSTTLASSTASSPSEVGDDRSSWGREIERGAHGEFSVFERDFGNGEKVLTHVTWADDRQAEGRAHAPE